MDWMDKEQRDRMKLLRPWYKKPLYIFFFGSCAIVAFAYFYNFFSGPPIVQEKSQERTQKPWSESSSSVPIGEIGILFGSSGTHSLVAISEEVLDEFIKARATKDEWGETLILGSDLVFLVKNGTKVRVIGHGKRLFKSEIRILEGEMKGSAGYVFSEWVKPL